MLTGSELLAKVKELGDVSKSDLVRSCGYVSTKKDGSERLNFTAFYEALLGAKGVSLGADSAGRGKGGRSLSYVATVQGNGNLLELSVRATRVRATVGEISETLASVFGRYKPGTQLVRSVYSRGMENNAQFDAARNLVAAFAKTEGRQPRILVAKMGQDGHDRGAKVIATGLADLGFDVDIGPLFQTPEEVARQAVENDVHVVGISSQAAGHKTLIPQLITELKKLKADDIRVIVGGIIPEGDHAFLKKSGVSAIFGPGTQISAAATEIIRALEKK